ncbi:TRAP transporter small permease [Glaciecola sp. HTCC2999]|jgi:TRAP-type C4-dicarboxylate transport system permease small subunit|uniref:TRAP transporter small permease n=1 Tax=Glaciecola sp. HTCC2999 TaxID=455436 RepID=UPI0000E0E287|nr:TRAP transporter small permease [Glaciecola sp. HTCC2999]
MNKFHNFILSGLKNVIILQMIAIVLIVSLQVFTRFVLQSSSSFTEELARFLLIWIGLFGAAYGYQMNAHLGLDIITNKLQGNFKKVIAAISHLFVLMFAIWVMVIGGCSLVALTLEPVQISAAMGIKMAYVYVAIPISGLLIVYFGLLKIVQLFSSSIDVVKEV